MLSPSPGKRRRLTLIECGNDLNTMIDVAKVADLVGALHMCTHVHILYVLVHKETSIHSIQYLML